MILKKEITKRVDSALLDYKNTIRPAGIFDLFQDIAKAHVTELGYSFIDMYNKGYYWVLLSQEYKVVSRLPLFDEIVKIVTYPKKREKLEFEREFEIRDKDDNLLIIASSNWVVIDTKNRMISRAKDVIFDGEYYDKFNYMEKAFRRLNLNPVNVIEEFNYKVSLSDIDSNMHMNNAKYLDIIYNMKNFDNYHFYNELKFAYVKEATLGQIINVKYYQENDYECYVGYIDGNVCFEAKLK